MSKGSAKTKNGKAPRPEVVAPPPKENTWEDVAKVPLAMFHTMGRGLIIGFIEGMNDSLIRIHAPAFIQELGPVNLAYVPMLGVERFMDLRQRVVFATMPVPALLAQGYLGYFEQFKKGSYRIKPVVVNAGIDAPEGLHTVPKADEGPAPQAEVAEPVAEPPAETPPA